MSSNPYSAPPTLDATPPPNATVSPRTLSEIARTTFLAWEKLRIVYVGLLGYKGYLLRWLLFSSGTLLTMIAAIIALSSHLLPAPN
jgi:hypothetical protein